MTSEVISAKRAFVKCEEEKCVLVLHVLLLNQLLFSYNSAHASVCTLV